MRDSVEAIFPTFSKKFEGRMAKMYPDINGDITVAVGNRIDPVNQAFGLGWVREQDGITASPQDVQRVWSLVKSRQDAKRRGGGWFQTLPGNDILLPPSAIDALVDGKLRFNASDVLRFFPGFETFPAEAQLGILSMAWAMGDEKFREFPRFVAAANANKWDVAAIESHMQDDANPGLVPRNAANKLLFENADVVSRLGLDPDRITWPAKLNPGLSNPGGGGGSPAAPSSHSESFWGAAIVGSLLVGGAILIRAKLAKREETAAP